MGYTPSGYAGPRKGVPAQSTLGLSVLRLSSARRGMVISSGRASVGGEAVEKVFPGRSVLVFKLADPAEEPGGGRLRVGGRGAAGVGLSGDLEGGNLGRGWSFRPSTDLSPEGGEFSADLLNPVELSVKQGGLILLHLSEGLGNGKLKLSLPTEEVALASLEGSDHPGGEGVAGVGRGSAQEGGGLVAGDDLREEGRRGGLGCCRLDPGDEPGRAEGDLVSVGDRRGAPD